MEHKLSSSAARCLPRPRHTLATHLGPGCCQDPPGPPIRSGSPRRRRRGFPGPGVLPKIWAHNTTIGRALTARQEGKDSLDRRSRARRLKAGCSRRPRPRGFHQGFTGSDAPTRERGPHSRRPSAAFLARGATPPRRASSSVAPPSGREVVSGPDFTARPLITPKYFSDQGHSFSKPIRGNRGLHFTEYKPGAKYRGDAGIAAYTTGTPLGAHATVDSSRGFAKTTPTPTGRKKEIRPAPQRRGPMADGDGLAAAADSPRRRFREVPPPSEAEGAPDFHRSPDFHFHMKSVWILGTRGVSR